MKNSQPNRFLILIGVYVSYNNDVDNQVLNGVYKETKPSSGIHQLHFVGNNTLIVKARNSSDEKFIYELNNNIIKLNPTQDLSQTWELEINIVNNSKFEIINIFYPKISKSKKTIQFVTFEK